jgi:copper chaperone
MSDVTTRFYVQSMKCGGCITAANEALATLPGFVSAEFDLAAGEAQVTGDIDPQAVCQILVEKGYPAVVKSA